MALTPEEIKRLREIEEQRRNRVVALLGDTGEVKVDPSSPFSSVLLGSPEPAPVPTPHPEPVAPQLDPVTTSSVSAPAPTPEEAKRGGIGGWWDGLGQDGQGRLGSALMAMSGGILGSNNGQDVWSALGGGMTAAANSLDGSERTQRRSNSTSSIFALIRCRSMLPLRKIAFRLRLRRSSMRPVQTGWQMLP